MFVSKGINVLKFLNNLPYHKRIVIFHNHFHSIQFTYASLVAFFFFKGKEKSVSFNFSFKERRSQNLKLSTISETFNTAKTDGKIYLHRIKSLLNK